MAGEATTTVDLNDPAIKAIVEDRVARETASLTEQRDTAVKERDEARTRNDVLEAEKTAAEQARDTATSELTAEREKAQNEQAATARRESRKTALTEKVPHLGDAWFAAEVAKDGEKVVTRLDRIAAMTDETFEPYMAEIAAAFEGVQVTPGTTTTTTAPPRETAMAATTHTSSTTDAGGSKASQFIGRVGYGGAVRSS